MGSWSHCASGFCILQFNAPVSKSCPGLTISAVITSSCPRTRFAGKRPQSTCGIMFRIAIEDGRWAEFSRSILSDNEKHHLVFLSGQKLSQLFSRLVDSKITIPRGGRLRFSENGRSCHGTESEYMPPMFPTPLPP